MIYTDSCYPLCEKNIITELKVIFYKRFVPEQWSINQILSIFPDPRLKIIVINNINEAAIMEIAIANFLCKKILVTTEAIKSYPLLTKTVDYIDYNCNLNNPNNNFISWFKYILEK